MKDESRIVKDPICGKDVDTLRARAVGIFGGVTYYFCSFECKAKFKDPRQVAPAQAMPPKDTGERRGRDPAALPPPPEALPEPVRYAHTRQRRNTGDMSAPVVDIDLSPDKPKQAEPSVELEVPRSSRAWTWIAIVMVIIAAGVAVFVLKK
jgi:YHS domain-containing protein